MIELVVAVRLSLQDKIKWELLLETITNFLSIILVTGHKDFHISLKLSILLFYIYVTMCVNN